MLRSIGALNSLRQHFTIYSLTAMSSELCPPYAPFFGFAGVASAVSYRQKGSFHIIPLTALH